jgi:integrase
MGSIRRAPRNDRRWEARFRDPIGGQRSKTFDNKADAKVFLAATEARIARGAWSDPTGGRLPFDEVAAAWLASNPTKRATTHARDATVIRVHLDPVLGDLPLAGIRPTHVQGVIVAMVTRGLAPKTVRTDYGVLRAILSWAVETDLIDRSPARGIRLPAAERTARPVGSAEEIERLAAAMPEAYRIAVYLGALGLRQGEVLGLRVGAIDFLRRTLNIKETLNEVEGRFIEGHGKTCTSVRTISVPDRILAELAAHLAATGRTDPTDLVLQAPEGGPVRATNFRRRIYDPALRRAGLEGLTFHRLRHSAGHMLRELGVPLEVIQRRLGHASIRTTADIYGSLPERVDRSVAAKLDDLLRQAGAACGAAVVQAQNTSPDTTEPGPENPG